MIINAPDYPSFKKVVGTLQAEPIVYSLEYTTPLSGSGIAGYAYTLYLISIDLGNRSAVTATISVLDETSGPFGPAPDPAIQFEADFPNAISLENVTTASSSGPLPGPAITITW